MTTNRTPSGQQYTWLIIGLIVAVLIIVFFAMRQTGGPDTTQPTNTTMPAPVNTTTQTTTAPTNNIPATSTPTR